MSNFWIIFLTGLTTGGLSCMAVQGGLLAGLLAQEVEQRQIAKRAIGTISAFLIAKLIAYTIFGFFLGWLGTFLQLTPLWHGLLQLLIGIFLIGNALRLLEVHPIFRYFILEPPRSLTKRIRQFSKQDDQTWLSAAFLGALTILIPCGVTQAMMLLAVGTGSPLQAALIMFFFILGTSPVFFALVYLATKLGERLHKHFLTASAVVVLLLGVISLEGALNILGSPVSFAALRQSFATQETATPLPSGPVSTAPANLTVQVDDGSGYQPARLSAPANQPFTVNFVTNGSYSCARALVFRSLGIQKLLPETGQTAIEIPAQPAGTVISYSCSMGMYRGQISIN